MLATVADERGGVLWVGPATDGDVVPPAISVRYSAVEGNGASVMWLRDGAPLVTADPPRSQVTIWATDVAAVWSLRPGTPLPLITLNMNAERVPPVDLHL